MTETEIEARKKELDQQWKRTGEDEIVRKEEDELSEEDKDLVKIIKLIDQFEQALAKGDLTKATELLAEIKEFANKEVWKKINKEAINKLEQRLAESINKQQTEQARNKLIISLGTISLLFLITSLYFVNQKAKSILFYWIKQIKHKNKRNH